MVHEVDVVVSIHCRLPIYNLQGYCRISISHRSWGANVERKNLGIEPVNKKTIVVSLTTFYRARSNKRGEEIIGFS